MTSVAESTRLLDIARSAALGVEAQLCAAFRSPMSFDTKRDAHDIVTAHDRAAEKRIVSTILQALPDSTIVGEEGGRQGNGQVVWYVDPIDGTSNFARGIAFWCVTIAASVGGKLVAGVIHDPIAGNTFSADLGGAWLNGKRLEARAAASEERAMLLTSFPNARHIGLYGDKGLAAQVELLDAFLALRNLGSGALQLAHVAAGWADAALGFQTNPWDVAAGILILEQAGGRYAGHDLGTVSEPSFLAHDYFAVGAGADFPTLERVARQVSGARSVDSRMERAS